MYTQEPKNEISRVVQKLAEDVREEDKTPLGIACSQGDLEVVRILVEAGAVDVRNACVEKASKALHHALVHILLSKGKIFFFLQYSTLGVSTCVTHERSTGCVRCFEGFSGIISLIIQSHVGLVGYPSITMSNITLSFKLNLTQVGVSTELNFFIERAEKRVTVILDTHP